MVTILTKKFLRVSVRRATLNRTGIIYVCPIFVAIVTCGRIYFLSVVASQRRSELELDVSTG